MWHSVPLCICRVMLAWISSEISTKLLGMPTHLDRSSLTDTGLTHADCSLLLSSVVWPLTSPFANWLLWVPCPTPTRLLFLLQVALRSRAQAFGWFSAKTDKGIVCLADQLHCVTNVAVTNYIEAKIDKTQQYSKWRLCANWDENVYHKISKCSFPALKIVEDKVRLDVKRLFTGNSARY